MPGSYNFALHLFGFVDGIMFSLPVAVVSKTGYHKDTLLLRAKDLDLSEAFGDSMVALDIELTQMAGSILARGRAKSIARLECAKCLCTFTREVEAPFTIEFDPVELGDAALDKDADHPEGYVAFLGETMPIGEELRQELELAIPFAPLCKPDCAGLCVRCGADLNQGPCGCADQAGQGAFARLGDMIQASQGKDKASARKGKRP